MEFIRLENQENITTITIHRPEKYNALNKTVVNELLQTFQQLQDDPNTKAIILTGTGEKSFVAGADISELAQLQPPQAKQLSQKGQHLTLLIENFPKPVIAAINGFALGGGLELALACHIRLASQNALLGLPEVSLGVIPGYGGTQRLPRLIGKGKAFELILTGKKIKAQEALEIGLINHVTPPEQLLEEAQKLAKQILHNAPLALSLAIEAVQRGTHLSLEDALNLEADLFSLCCTTQDMKEGTQAFLEKRKPNFQGK
ncbi:MAG: enoyl-CoA hydratase [Planctomycetota bacterium]|nr:MAG: enoyl-CoA hydratase [Planctomycetota bacterium]